MGENQITVAVTPDGYADAVRDDKFVMPEEREMTMGQFLDILESPNEHSGVFYVQKQNSNLTEEFEDLNDDVEPHIPFATNAFGLCFFVRYITRPSSYTIIRVFICF